MPIERSADSFPSASTKLKLARGLSRFLAWWGRELAVLVPPTLRHWGQPANDVLLLSLDGSRCLLERLTPVGRQQVMDFEPPGNLLAESSQTRQKIQAAVRSSRVLLKVHHPHVLRRTLTLPLAVEENLRQTLTYELDRYTPFRPDQAYFDFRLLERDPVQGRITVEIAAVERSVIDQVASRAASLGLTPAGATLIDDARGGEFCFDLLPASDDTNRLIVQPKWRKGLPWLAAGLFSIWLAVPIWQKHALAKALQESVAEAKTNAQEVGVLRERLDLSVRERNFLIDMKWDSHSALQVLEELSKRLPDDTFVFQLDFDGKTVQLQGESASASSLVELLENSPLFKDVGFQAQLLKMSGTRNDRFHLSATLEQPRRP